MARKQIGASKTEWCKHLRSNRSGHNKRVRHNVNQAVQTAVREGYGIDWLHYVRGPSKEQYQIEDDLSLGYDDDYEWWRGMCDDCFDDWEL